MTRLQFISFAHCSLLLTVPHFALGLTLPSGENFEVVNGSIKAVGPVILNKSSTQYNTSVATAQPAILLGENNSNLGTGGGLNPGRGFVVGEGNLLATHIGNSAGYGIVLGYNNEARVYGAVVAGSGNIIAPETWNPALFSKYTSVFGRENTVHPGNDGSYASLVIGRENQLTGDYTMIGGRLNTVGGKSLGSETIHSFAFGEDNMIASDTAWTIGRGNELTGLESSAFGTGLLANSRGTVVLGTYNESPVVTGSGGTDLKTSYFSGSPLLVVGNGTADNVRSNALVLRRSGDLEVAGTIYQGGSPIATQTYATAAATTAIDNKFGTKVGLAGGDAIGENTTATSGGLAVGDWSTAMSMGMAEGWFSVAMTGGVSYGSGSTSMSYGNASGQNSVAMNWGYALGNGSFAVAGSALGNNSVAFGGTASGHESVAIGRNNQAEAFSSVVMGSGGIASGISYLWEETDALFALGNSLYDFSNAITTLKNGQTTLTNKFWDGELPQAIPSNATESSQGNALVVEGHSRLKGNTVLDGKVTISEAQGDISMGIYQ